MSRLLLCAAVGLIGCVRLGPDFQSPTQPWVEHWNFGQALPIPFIAPMLALTILAVMNRPLPFKASLGLALVLMITTGSGLLLIPLLQYYAAVGVMLVCLGLFLVFRYGMRGGSALVATFMVVGLTMISAAGATDFDLALQVVVSLVKGMLLALTAVSISHWLFPDPIDTQPPAPAPTLSADEVNWLALRAALVVMPAFLLALIDPASYMPIIMKSVNLGQQSTVTSARSAGRELLGSTLLGQSVQDSAAGKDVYTAFTIRMGLFILVTLYACAMVYLLDNRRQRRNASNPTSTEDRTC